MTKKKAPNKEIKKTAQEIEAVYQQYLTELEKLKTKQNKIINKFIRDLEKRKVEEIKKALNN